MVTTHDALPESTFSTGSRFVRFRKYNSPPYELEVLAVMYNKYQSINY